jgi:hypothetical protein
MKKISLTLFAVILFIAATLNASAQKEETRQVTGFNGISSGGSFNVHVKIDGTESLKIVADEDVLPKIETIVENNKLEIRFKKSSFWHNVRTGKIDIYVTAKSLSSLALSGSGSIKLDGNLSGNDVKVTVSGSGNIVSTVKANELNTSMSGSGSIKIDGSSTNTNISVSGSGSIHGRDLKTENVSVSVSGSGNVNIHADKSLSAHIAGSGNITYSGNATVSNVSTAGSGRIRKAD